MRKRPEWYSNTVKISVNANDRVWIWLVHRQVSGGAYGRPGGSTSRRRWWWSSSLCFKYVFSDFFPLHIIFAYILLVVNDSRYYLTFFETCTNFIFVVENNPLLICQARQREKTTRITPSLRYCRLGKWDLGFHMASLGIARPLPSYLNLKTTLLLEDHFLRTDEGPNLFKCTSAVS